MILLDNINEILRREDIEGFISLGAPSDEYSHEAKDIALAIEALPSGTGNVQEINSIIIKVWDKSFGPFAESEIAKRAIDLKIISEKILAL